MSTIEDVIARFLERGGFLDPDWVEGWDVVFAGPALNPCSSRLRVELGHVAAARFERSHYDAIVAHGSDEGDLRNPGASPGGLRRSASVAVERTGGDRRWGTS